MLKLRAWVFFGVLLLIGSLIVGFSPSFQACMSRPGPEAPTSQPQKHGTTVAVAMSARDCLSRFYTENRDDIVAAFALILAIAAIFLWFATRDLITGIEGFSKMQLRAYLGPSESYITGVAVGERPVVESTIRNFGQTPAHRVTYWADAKVLDPMVDGFDRAPPDDGVRTINPGRDGFTIRSRLAEPLTEEEMTKIKLGTSAIYFYGVITYRDAFWRSRKTQFRFQHGGARVVGTNELAISPKGNKAT